MIRSQAGNGLGETHELQSATVPSKGEPRLWLGLAQSCQRYSRAPMR